MTQNNYTPSMSIVSTQVLEWLKYPGADIGYSCKGCRCHSKALDRRVTDLGVYCLDCWLGLPICTKCEVGVAISPMRGEKLCAKCLNPEYRVTIPLHRTLE